MIEQNRAYVEKRSEGKVGYIYVPNTGVDGQNDLFRQFIGVARWARTGAIIGLLLERRRADPDAVHRAAELPGDELLGELADGQDWTWPPDSHQGPKAMPSTGLRARGGQIVPWLFKHDKISARSSAC